MNLPLVRSISHPWRRGHRLLISQLAPTNTLIASFSSSSSSAQIDSLQNRILGAKDSSISTDSVIQKWLEEGEKIELSGLRSIVKKLRYNRRYIQALKISEFMVNRWGSELTNIDIAVRLELISRVHGLKEAETFFNSLSGSSLDHSVYGALLNCYAQTKQVEKAEATMRKMKDSGFLDTAIPYNVMLNLYYQTGKYGKLEILMMEMEKRGIECNMSTYMIRLQAYAACSNTQGMEKLLGTMEADPGTKLDFHCCITAANGYLKARLVEKALMMLKKSESLIVDSRKNAYEILITSYAAIKQKNEMYRIWDLYKELGKFVNTGYIAMISSLVKLNDIEGAEKIWEEWNSGKIIFDIRIPNMMIAAYSRKGYLEKAEAIIKMTVESGKELDSSSWDYLTVGYRSRGQMEKAVEMVKKAITASKRGKRVPSLGTLSECLKHLRNHGDKESADEFLKMVKENYHFSPGALKKWLSCI